MASGISAQIYTSPLLFPTCKCISPNWISEYNARTFCLQKSLFISNIKLSVVYAPLVNTRPH